MESIKYFICFLFLLPTLLYAQGIDESADSKADQRNYLYHLSEDQLTLTVFDLKWEQMYKVYGYAELPEDFSGTGDVWYERGRLSVRESADRTLHFSIDDQIDLDGTLYLVAGISRYYGANMSDFADMLRKGEIKLSLFKDLHDCTCFSKNEVQDKDCMAGGQYSTGCGIDASYCEVDCATGYFGCCNLSEQ